MGVGLALLVSASPAPSVASGPDVQAASTSKVASAIGRPRRMLIRLPIALATCAVVRAGVRSSRSPLPLACPGDDEAGVGAVDPDAPQPPSHDLPPVILSAREEDAVALR